VKNFDAPDNIMALRQVQQTTLTSRKINYIRANQKDGSEMIVFKCWVCPWLLSQLHLWC